MTPDLNTLTLARGEPATNELVDDLVSRYRRLETAGYEFRDEARKERSLLARIEVDREKMEEAAKLADFQIPYYAYGDNEAACDMAHRLTRILEILR